MTSPNMPRYQACRGSNREHLLLIPTRLIPLTTTSTPHLHTECGSSSASSTTPTHPHHKGALHPATTPSDCMLVEEVVVEATLTVGVVVLLHRTPTSPRAEWANC